MMLEISLVQDYLPFLALSQCALHVGKYNLIQALNFEGLFSQENTNNAKDKRL